MPYSCPPEEFLTPSDDNPWMLGVAEDWIAETNDVPGEHNAGINMIAWTAKNPEATFGVIQTILKLAEGDERLFDQVGAGPLESFLSLCPEDFFEFVCQVARIDPRLCRAFRHVWQCGMSAERFKVVRSYAERGTG